MESIPQSRRHFITTIILLAASAGLLWRYLTPSATKRRTALATAARVSVPAEGALVFREQRIALMRTGESFYALSLVCTHLGCTVAVTETGLSCPCHGSRFDQRGLVLQGPADKPLQQYSIEEHNGIIEVYGA
ncbi:MAG: Rieske (2Fe-2S) protein [Desulfuromonadaceae bacterium]|nr:Rieske (2Fe-2S) protein [Desulfuromonadaceae bacterium]MDD5105734.1 Rieske (2Fe-2S) protein [Desulfuromonadaceae bacterium]